ncbi:hypothetical protein RRG08_024429 [Elysia crispata]|uniref:Reverse transcriptase/retrotransposon-derived protein RNase H-like domain-containing protein n=1 Tax=Elysia crispata TaxID=231223 RepID=A0AAE1D221_9GAST|nr:hypothetical protein RRG08_024429 [Elysia crispata]
MNSFQCLKNLLYAAPLLAYADFTKPFELHIDASNDADALSHLPSARIDIVSVQAMCSVDFAPFAATMAVFADKTEEETSPFPHISLTELRQAQNVDEILGVWMTAMRKRECPTLKRTPNPAEHGIVKGNWRKFCFYCGLSHRKVEG